MTRLLHDAGSLVQLDRQVVKAVVESNVEALRSLLPKYREQKIRVQAWLSQLPAVGGVTDDESELLSRVQREFPTDSIIRQLEPETRKEGSFYELTDEEISELGSDLLYSWISHYEYVRNIFKVNTLILRTQIPPALMKYVGEARNCFALEQYHAVVSLCRTILEAALKHICEEKDLFEPDGEKVIEINPSVFNQLLRAVSSDNLKKRAIRLYYRDACPVVHGDRIVDANDALRVLRETTALIQDLYAFNGL